MISFPAAAFATNCYILAPGAGQECVIVDPGIGVVDTVAAVLAEHRLRPAAVLLTHGHLDHVYSVTPVCRGGGAAYLPAFVHTEDRYRLADPIRLLDPALVSDTFKQLQQQFGAAAQWTEPDDIRLVEDGDPIEVAGLRFVVRHAPGHTEGSVMFGLDGVPDGINPDFGLDATMISGDVLFAGSIGRTDLAGGSSAAMTRSLRDVVLPLPDSTLVLPGHGPATTMGRERQVNPHLQGLGA